MNDDDTAKAAENIVFVLLCWCLIGALLVAGTHPVSTVLAVAAGFTTWPTIKFVYYTGKAWK